MGAVITSRAQYRMFWAIANGGDPGDRGLDAATCRPFVNYVGKSAAKRGTQSVRYKALKQRSRKKRYDA